MGSTTSLTQKREAGAALLDEVRTTLETYIVFPSAEASAAYALWIAASHAQPHWEHATRFVLKSPIKRCGKTRAQEIGRELVHRPISTTNISVAALVRSIDEKDPPTLFLDEADTVFGRKRGEESSEDLRGILNSGHSRGWPYIRWDPKLRQSEECATFSMALLGGIGDLPDTIEDRAVVVSMRRRAPGEPVATFRRRRVIPRLHVLRARLASWVGGLDLADLEPEMPVEDRDADKWEPLIAIADSAGGHWPITARRACEVLCDVEPDDSTAGERLLADLEAVWGDASERKTDMILNLLHAVDEAPWGDWYGKPLTARALAKLLKPYGIRSQNLVIGDARPKGYARIDFEDAWTRYRRVPATGATSATEDAEAFATSGNVGSGNVADSVFQSATRPDQGQSTPVAQVADVAAERSSSVTPTSDLPAAILNWARDAGWPALDNGVAVAAGENAWRTFVGEADVWDQETALERLTDLADA